MKRTNFYICCKKGREYTTNEVKGYTFKKDGFTFGVHKPQNSASYKITLLPEGICVGTTDRLKFAQNEITETIIKLIKMLRDKNSSAKPIII